MTLDRFVALDVEVASRTPLRVCSIGVVRIDAGREVDAYQSLVHVDGPIRYGHIHRLTSRDLADAPMWPQVWTHVLRVLGDVDTIVAFRASFDRSAVLTMAAHYNLRLPRLRFVCAAKMIEERYGVRGSLRDAVQTLGRSFPGQPHDPLADARAAALVAQACMTPLLAISMRDG